jgi:hypothetical protein
LNLLAEIMQTGARIERHHLFNLLQQQVMAQTIPIHWRGDAPIN